MVGDVEEGGQRREPDELGLGRLDALLARASAATASQTRQIGVTAKSSRFIETWAQSGSSSRKPFAWTRGRPPPDSRTARAIRFASSRSVESRLMFQAMRNGRAPTAIAPAVGWIRAGPEVRAAVRVAGDLVLEALVLAAPDVGELDAVGPGGRLGVEVDRDAEPVRDPRAEARASATQSSIVVSPERHERDDVDGPDPRVLARSGCSMSIASMATATVARARRRPPPRSPASVSTLRLWLASLVRSRRWTPGVAGDGRGEPVDDVEPPALANVRDGLDQPIRHAAIVPRSARTRRSDGRSRP